MVDAKEGVMAKPKLEFEPLWIRALSEEFGLAIVLEGDPVLVMNDLYATRTAMNDPRFESLRIAQMKDGSLWIVKKDVKLEEVEMPDANKLG
jgi:hypothetical protein